MTTINLKEFFYWYKTDEYIEVTDEVAEELRADKRYEVTHHRRMKRNKANYSLDADGGIEYAACEFEPSPEMALDLMEQSSLRPRHSMPSTLRPACFRSRTRCRQRR